MIGFFLFTKSAHAIYGAGVYSSRDTITITNPNNRFLTYYPVLVNLSYSNIENQADCADFKCVDFANSTDVEIPFYRNQTVIFGGAQASLSWAEFYLNITNLSTSGQTVYAYYRNSTPVSDNGTNPLSAWLNWTINVNSADYSVGNQNGCNSCNVTFGQNDIGALVVLTVNSGGTDPKGIIELRNDTSQKLGEGGGTGTDKLYIHDDVGDSLAPNIYKYFTNGFNNLFTYNMITNYTFTFYANATFGPTNFTMNVQNDTTSTNYSRPIINEGGDGASGNIGALKSVAVYKDSGSAFNLYVIKVRKYADPEPYVSSIVNGLVTFTSCFASPSLTFQYFDEESPFSKLNLSSFVSLSWFDTQSRNIGFNFSANTSHSICMSGKPSTLVNVSMDVPVANTSYPVRHWFAQFFNLSSTTVQTINITALNSTLANSTSITIKDVNGFSIDGAVLKVERYYANLGVYIENTRALTDSNGISIIYLRPDVVYYRFSIIQNGILLQSLPAQIVPSQVTTGNFNVPIPISLTLGISQNISVSISPSSACTLVDTTETILTCSWSDPSLSTQEADLFVDRLNVLGATTRNCTIAGFGQTGSMNCDLGASAGNNGTTFHYTLQLVQATNGTNQNVTSLLVTNNFISGLTANLYGNIGIFVALFILATIPMVGLWNPVVGVSLTILSVILVTQVGLVNLGYVTGVLPFMIAGIVIIYKLRS